MAVTEIEFVRRSGEQAWNEWSKDNPKAVMYQAFMYAWEQKYFEAKSEHDATEDPNWLMLKDVSKRILEWGNSRVNSLYNGHVAYLNQQRKIALMEVALADAGIEQLDVPLYRRIANQRKVIKQLTAERDMWKNGLTEKWKEEQLARGESVLAERGEPGVLLETPEQRQREREGKDGDTKDDGGRA